MHTFSCLIKNNDKGFTFNNQDTKLMAESTSLKNILFDLGGVILDINVLATKEKFYNLGFPAKLLSYPENRETDLFYKYETGQLSTEAFRNAIRDFTGLNFKDGEFDAAWNAMIVDIPKERTDMLIRLAQTYELYMLSNTSPLHVPVYEKMFERSAGVSMAMVFNRRYYSHKIGFHKPDAEAYEYVIKETGIIPEETLFLDDNIHNIKAAQELGFHAIHIHERTDMLSIGYGI